jgi:hypothetical protein
MNFKLFFIYLNSILLVFGVIFEIAKIPGLPFVSFFSILSVTIFLLLIIINPHTKISLKSLLFLTLIFLCGIFLAPVNEIFDFLKIFIYTLICILSNLYILNKILSSSTIIPIFLIYSLISILIFSLEVSIFPNLLVYRNDISFDQLYPFYIYFSNFFGENSESRTDSFLGNITGLNTIRLVGFYYEPSFAAFGYTLFSTIQILNDSKNHSIFQVKNKIFIFGIFLALTTQSLSMILSVFCFFAIKISDKKFLGFPIISRLFLPSIFFIFYVLTVYFIFSGESFNQRIEFWSSNLFFNSSQNYLDRNMFYESILSWDLISGPLDSILFLIFGVFLIYIKPLLFPIIFLFWYSGFPIYTFASQCLIALGIIIWNYSYKSKN